MADYQGDPRATPISGLSMLACFFLGGIPAMILRDRGRTTWGAIWRSHALFWGILVEGAAFDAWGASLGWGNPFPGIRELRGATLLGVAVAAAVLLPVWVWLWPRFVRR